MEFDELVVVVVKEDPNEKEEVVSRVDLLLVVAPLVEAVPNFCELRKQRILHQNREYLTHSVLMQHIKVPVNTTSGDLA